MKRLLVLGASGMTGQHVIQQSLARGYQVTAFVRQPDSLARFSEPLRIVQGDIVTQPDALIRALDGQDAVISALGRGHSLRPNGLIEQSVRTIVPAMEKYGPPRLVFTSALGVGRTYAQAPLPARVFFRTLLARVYADKALGDDMLRRSRLEWTLVHPSKLTDGRATGRYRIGEHLELRWWASVSRADVAGALMRCVEDPSTIRQSLIVSA